MNAIMDVEGAINAKILKMNDADTIRFLELYESEPVLWDSTLADYKSRENRKAAAKRIATALNLKGFNEMYVIVKFKNLRSSYSQELKKIAESKKSGCPPEELYVPKVVWFDTMDSFLRPYVTQRVKVEQTDDSSMTYESPRRSRRGFPKFRHADPSESTPEALPTIPLVDISAPSHVAQPSISQQSVQCQLLLLPSQRGEKRTNEGAPIPCQTTRTSAVHNYKSAGNAETENSINSAVLELEEMKRTNHLSSIKEDCFDHFGRYVASLLRNLPSQTAFELQQEVINLILQPHVFATVDSGPLPSANRCNGVPSESIE